ncbi:phosphate/phosphite/phosphonate ABC transporter substrate-binding protein [Amphritea balenae]|uniref:Solute-binding protein family 3/N-terminal domain-containing protein n=1 Tax=Amphritea balenae TaxID=452629 RepID=A0A3P1SL98_9GAMM|nr:PhnD/SsuA/transferrin family substrate-binding protein [Amphritea balenae]RRC97052.1 hypothetical protein EHS89_19020 [Amphritea balenae]GGK67579.1 hypothetical protein GCM10007941_17140 [Amphritea balenae]
MIRKYNTCLIASITTLLLITSPVYAEPLSLHIDVAEGGRLSDKNITALESFLEPEGCDIRVVRGQSGTDLKFIVAPADKELVSAYESLAQPRTWQGQALTSSLLVKKSTAISSLEALQGQRIAFVSDDAYLGRKLAEAALNKSGVKVASDDIYITGGYQGSMTMLLHGDVFAAAIAGPLAKRWVKANDLSIIYTSADQAIGGLWIKKNLPSEVKRQCRSAFSKVQRESRRDAKMRLFPLWLEGFLTPDS